MELRATVRDANGQQLDLPSVLVPDDATKDSVVQRLSQRGYEVLNLSRLGTTTTTPISGVSFPRAVGRTVLATGKRAFGAATEAAKGIETGEALRHPLTFASNVATAALPIAAPELTVPGMVTETIGRMQPGTGEKEAAELASAGQLGATAVAIPKALVGAGVRGGRAALQAIRQPAKAAEEAAPAAPTSFGGVREAAIAKGVSETTPSVDVTTFARKVRPVFRRMLRDMRADSQRLQTTGASQAERAALEPRMRDLQRLVGKSESLAPIANEVAKDPQLMATLLHDSGAPAQALEELQGAWNTAAIASATGGKGLSRGLFDVEKYGKLWNELGVEGQQALFGDKAAKIRDFLRVIAETEPTAATVATAAPAVKAATRGSSIFKAGLSLATGTAAFELLGGHLLGTMGATGVTLAMGKLMLKNGGIEWLTEVGRAMKDARVFAQAAPQLRQSLMAIMAADLPPVQRRGPFPQAAPMAAPPVAPAPAVPGGVENRFPGVADTPDQIREALSATLPPGFRPGRSAYTR